MPKPYGFTAKGKIHTLLKTNPTRWFSVHDLTKEGYSRSQISYAMGDFLTVGWVERRLVSIKRNRGGNYGNEYRWKPKEQTNGND